MSVIYEEIENPRTLSFKAMEYSDNYAMISAMNRDPAILAIPELIGSVGNVANGKLLKKIKSQNMNLAVSLAEFRSTANTVGDFAKSVARVLIQPKMVLGHYVAKRLSANRHTWTRRIRTLKSTREKDAVNAYLAYTYGLRPIMSDINGSLEALSSRLSTGLRRRDKVSHTRSARVEGTGPFGASFSSREVQYGITCEYQVDTAVQALSKVGVTNPALAIYELIPYSFVFDWIVPVGDYLSHLDALTGVSDFVMVERIKETLIQETSSGYRYTRVYKHRGHPTTKTPRVVLTYQPSSSLKNALDGITLLMQRKT